MTKVRGKTLVLIRHAHRDTSDREADNGLSDKGRKQAAALLKHFLKEFPTEELKKEPPRVLSSPKRRCVETVAALAKDAGVRIELEDELLEQQPKESGSEMRKRAERFMSIWRKEPEPRLMVVCSHGDWLPAALEAATGVRVELKKGGWAEVQLDRAEPVLKRLIQKL